MQAISVIPHVPKTMIPGINEQQMDIHNIWE
jgi:hypothetical protein